MAKTPRENDGINTKNKGKTSLEFKIFNIASMAVAILALISYGYFAFDDIQTTRRKDLIEKNKILELEENVQILIKKNNRLQELKDSLRGFHDTVSVPQVTYSRFTKLEEGIENLNKIILEDPEKAISIPLLRTEIQNLKEQNQKELNSVKEDIAMVYDMNKWIIGLVFAMLVSIIILNVGNLLNKPKK